MVFCSDLADDRHHRTLRLLIELASDPIAGQLGVR